jgi:hypothetical protein
MPDDDQAGDRHQEAQDDPGDALPPGGAAEGVEDLDETAYDHQEPHHEHGDAPRDEGHCDRQDSREDEQNASRSPHVRLLGVGWNGRVGIAAGRVGVNPPTMMRGSCGQRKGAADGPPLFAIGSLELPGLLRPIRSG